jgi:hypothetical protein
MGEEFGRLERKHAAEMAELRVEIARMQAAIAGAKIDRLTDAERILERFEARLTAAIGRALGTVPMSANGERLPH